MCVCVYVYVYVCACVGCTMIHINSTIYGINMHYGIYSCYKAHHLITLWLFAPNEWRESSRNIY